MTARLNPVQPLHRTETQLPSQRVVQRRFTKKLELKYVRRNLYLRLAYSNLTLAAITFKIDNR